MSNMQPFISNYAAYNLWSNQVLIDWLRTVDTKLLYQITPSSYDSIDHTLQHILRVQGYWLKFITDGDHLNHSWEVREGEVGNIMAELLENSVSFRNHCSAFTEEELLQVLHLHTDWAKNDLSRYEYIVHAINHNTYHRGQIITMARCLGITEGIVNTDYNMFNSQSVQS